MFFIERFEEKKNENYSFMFNSYHKLAISQTPPPPTYYFFEWDSNTLPPLTKVNVIDHSARDDISR